MESFVAGSRVRLRKDRNYVLLADVIVDVCGQLAARFSDLTLRRVSAKALRMARNRLRYELVGANVSPRTEEVPSFELEIGAAAGTTLVVRVYESSEAIQERYDYTPPPLEPNFAEGSASFDLSPEIHVPKVHLQMLLAKLLYHGLWPQEQLRMIISHWQMEGSPLGEALPGRYEAALDFYVEHGPRRIRVTEPGGDSSLITFITRNEPC